VSRFIIFMLLFFHNLFAFSQSVESQLWMETGVKGRFVKRLDYTIDWTNRIGNQGFETMFPQASIKYKVNDWFRPSIDYRYVIKRELNSNYNGSNRLNFNVQFNKLVNRLNLGFRLRYQYSFDRVASVNYQPEFDQAFRLKPSISYDINNSIFSPSATLEFFYNPSNAPLGKRFSKIRSFVGVSLELKGPHDFALGYVYDQSLNLPNPTYRHILNMSYCYKIQPKKKGKRKTMGVRWL
jgi:hypothetical protein